jgi:hypothetical protein
LEALQARHFEHFERLHGDYDANNDEDRHPLITLDFENVRAALAWGLENQKERACDFVWALNYYMQMRQSLDVRREVLAAAHSAALAAGYAREQANTIEALMYYLYGKGTCSSSSSHCVSFARS